MLNIKKIYYPLKKTGSKIVIKIKRLLWLYVIKPLYQFWLCLIRPYPFQIWIAPRNILLEKDPKSKYKSPPGFVFKNEKSEYEYAAFLYPDNIATHWSIFILFIFVFPKLLEAYFFTLNEASFLSIEKWKGTAWSITVSYLFFLLCYWIIYFFLRRPILEDLFSKWPSTDAQERYFQSVPARITFSSKEDLEEYHRKFWCRYRSYSYFSIIKSKTTLYSLVRKVELYIEKIFCCYQKRISYYSRPIFFNPEESLQDIVLRIGISSFFTEEKNSIWNIILFVFYSLSHIWVTYLFLLFQLLCIFIKGKPAVSQNETIYLIIQSVLWATFSAVSLTMQFSFINSYLLKINKRNFNSIPPIIISMLKNKLHINRKIIDFFNPKKSVPIILGAVFTIYLVLLNLALQYK